MDERSEEGVGMKVDEDEMSGLCPEWPDDQRMNVLFAPLRARELNPESWAGKVKFWSQLISRWSASNRILVFDISKLKAAFVRKGKYPYCLEEVLEHSVTDGTFSSSQQFLTSLGTPHQSWGAWMVSKGANVVKAVGSKVLGSVPGELLVPDIVQQTSARIIETLQTSEFEPVIPGFKYVYLTEEQVALAIGQSTVDPRSKEVLLETLLEQRNLLEFVLDKRKFYKLTVHGEPTAKIDDVDKGIVRLKVSVDHLNVEIYVVEAKLAEERENVKKSLQLGNRTKAKLQLKRQKRLEKQLDSIMSQQLNLEHIYDQLIHAETNKKLLAAYNKGLSAMKSMIDPTTAEKASATMEELAELLEVNKEISDTFTKDVDTELEDLEKELEQLGDEGSLVTGDKPAITETGDKASKDKVHSPKPKACSLEPVKSGSNSTEFDRALENLDALSMDDLEPIITAKKPKIADLGH